jgi:hypothetical protein
MGRRGALAAEHATADPRSASNGEIGFISVYKIKRQGCEGWEGWILYVSADHRQDDGEVRFNLYQRRQSVNFNEVTSGWLKAKGQ